MIAKTNLTAQQGDATRLDLLVAQVLSPQYNSNLSRTNDIFNHSNLHFWQCAPRSCCAGLLTPSARC